MVQASNLGYPRIGLKRELKKALEQFWSGKSSETEVLEQAATLRKQHWQLQQQLGLTHIPSNDFSLYDHVLDTIAMVGAIPKRYHWKGPHVDRRTYFVMARGVLQDQEQSSAIPAMEMTKWFDTNYHYIVPEFEAEQQFSLASTKPVDEFLEAKALGIHTRPVLLGPVSFLLLGKTHSHEVKPLSLLGRLLPVYEDVLLALARAGADWLQIDEPCLVLDSVYPPDHKRNDLPSDAQRVFNVLFQGCAKDASCNAKYPNLESVFYKLVDTLNAHPISFNTVDPTTNKSYPVWFAGNDLVGWLFSTLYVTSFIPALPQTISQIRAHNYSQLSYLYGFVTFDDTFSDGMFYSTTCSEDWAFLTKQDVIKSLQGDYATHRSSLRSV